MSTVIRESLSPSISTASVFLVWQYHRRDKINVLWRWREVYIGTTIDFTRWAILFAGWLIL